MLCLEEGDEIRSAIFVRALVAVGCNYSEDDMLVWGTFSWGDCHHSTDRISPRLIHRW